jgi:tRNA nucleotidyltransferase (CCA-adding enzyme)
MELEQIGHEVDGLKVLAALEAEGWMKVLFPAWAVAKADEEKLKALHDLAAELQIQGVHPDMSAAQMQLLTAKLASKDVAGLKKQLLRPGFVEEWDSLDALASSFSKVLLAKPALTPSATFKLFTSYDPEAVLWLGFTGTSAPVKERYNQFLKVWPEAKQRIPNALMQEMRITPELPQYNEIVHKIFLELIDGRLTTPEETRAFLEPFSPPAPPPQITIKRSRAKRGAEPKVKERSFDDDDEEAVEEDADLDDIGGDEEEIDLGIPKLELEADLGEEDEAEGDEEEAEDESDEDAAPRRGKKGAGVPVKLAGSAPKQGKESTKQAAPKSAQAEKVAPKQESKPAAKPAPANPGPAAKPVAPAAKSKPQPPPAAKKSTPPAPAKTAPAAKPAGKKAAAKPIAKPPAKGPAKAAGKPAAKSASSKAAPAKKKAAPPAKTKAVKPPVKKSAAKGGKKR